MAKSCGEHLKTLIGNLLEYSKLKAKKIELNKATIDLRANITRILKMNYIKSQERQNKLMFFCSVNLPKKVITDEQRVNQVLINLISNALKFTEKGSVSVYLGWRPGFTNVESQSYLDSLKENPIHYLEQKHLFQHLENIEEEEEQTYRKNSYDSLSQNDGTYKHVNSLDNPHKFSIQNDSELIRIQSNFDLDNVSARDFMRSSTDQKTNDLDKTTKHSKLNQDLTSFFI